jgi:hypothetical protein
MNSPSAGELWQLLPEIYRTEDNGTAGAPGDLAQFLGSFQGLLDQLHATLAQRLADCFPDQPSSADELACQTWLLPYFAQLLDAQLLSPLTAGQRREVAEVIGWRQRKGTHPIANSIAEAITGRDPEGNGGRHVEHQEGWQRVLTTLRLDPPVFPDPQRPTVGTIDTRLCSYAVQTEDTNPIAHESTFDQPPAVYWTQQDPNAAPLYPDSYEDVSPRTADLRPPGRRAGHAHPSRFLVYVAPPDGYFPPPASPPSWGAPAGAIQQTSVTFDDGQAHVLADCVIGTLTVSNPQRAPGTTEVSQTTVSLSACTIDTLTITGDTSTAEAQHVVTDCVITNLTVTDAVIILSNCQVDNAVVHNDLSQVSATLDSCAVATLTGSTPSATAVVSRSVIGEITAGGTMQLEYCTVLGITSLVQLNASDCIFVGNVDLSDSGAIRYSCLTGVQAPPNAVGTYANTDALPIFVAGFGTRGGAVLDPATSDAIRFGAEDGGEMGAYHDLGYARQDQAIVEKLEDHLPYGLVPVLIPDPRLHVTPPSSTSPS